MQPWVLVKKIRQEQAPCVLDVRSRFEFESGHIPGAVHAPLGRILRRRVTLPKDRSSLIVVTCERGPRAAVIRALLCLFGYRSIELLEGHMAAWRRAGLPLHRET